MVKPYPIREVECADCGTKFKIKAQNAKRCPECKIVYQREQNKSYRARHKEKLAAKVQELRAADPEAFNAATRARRARRKDEANAVNRAWCAANKRKLSLQRRCRQFGLTLGELYAWFEIQSDACPICLETLNIEQDFDVDHDHVTGEVRGVLHPLCNRGMGLLRDDPNRCERASAYLRRGQSRS